MSRSRVARVRDGFHRSALCSKLRFFAHRQRPPIFRWPRLLVRQSRLQRLLVRALAVSEPRTPSVGSCPAFRPGGSRALPFDGSLALPWHPSRSPDHSRLRPTTGAVRAATPPDRRTPRDAWRSRWTRCFSPTCATVDLPCEHPIESSDLRRLSAPVEEALDGAPPASEGLSSQPLAHTRVRPVFAVQCPLASSNRALPVPSVSTRDRGRSPSVPACSAVAKASETHL